MEGVARAVLLEVEVFRAVRASETESYEKIPKYNTSVCPAEREEQSDHILVSSEA